MNGDSPLRIQSFLVHLFYSCFTVISTYTPIDHVRDKAWSSCYLEFPFHSRNFCFMFEGKSTKEMCLKPRVVWRS